MTAVTTEIVAFLTAMLNVIFTVLTPAATGPTPLQVIIYAGFAVGFLGAMAALIKGLAKG